MPPITVLHQAARGKGTYPTSEEVPPVGTRTLTVALILADADALDSGLKVKVYLEQTHDGVRWVEMGSGAWQGGPPKVAGDPPGKLVMNPGLATAHLPLAVRADVAVVSDGPPVNIGATFEFAS